MCYFTLHPVNTILFFSLQIMKNCFWQTYNLSYSSPPSKRTHGLPFSEKLLFNIQTAFKSVKVWLFCMILNNTTLNVDSISKKTQTTLSNKKKKRSSTSWTIPLRVLFILAQGDTWFSQKTFFHETWVLIRIAALGFILHQLQRRYRPDIKCRACLWDMRTSC